MGAGNSFGTLFKITTFGESHGVGIGVVIDGCPAGLSLKKEHIQEQLNRRKPGQSAITTDRKESDEVEILSGIFEDQTTGVPIALFIRNKDQKSADYGNMKDLYRPSHADYTYQEKYGIRDYRGGGRSSARETAARVAAGAVAQQLLAHFGIQVRAYVSSVGPIELPRNAEIDYQEIEQNLVRCPNKAIAQEMENLISELKEKGDSTGGVITCEINHVPVGLGEPVFDRLEADLAKAMLSINATKGFEIGSGFAAAKGFGTEMNDAFSVDQSDIRTTSNNSGGVLGGISNGEQIYFRVAFKPVATIALEQQTVTTSGESTTLSAKGRHDPCVVPRAIPIVEAMAALVLADHLLRNRVTRIINS